MQMMSILSTWLELFCDIEPKKLDACFVNLIKDNTRMIYPKDMRKELYPPKVF